MRAFLCLFGHQWTLGVYRRHLAGWFCRERECVRCGAVDRTWSR
jgi:hypothetical protein